MLAAVFFVLSLALAYVATNQPRDSGSVIDRVQRQKAVDKKEATPVVPGTTTTPDAGSQKPAPAPAEGAKDKNVPQ